MEHIASEQMTLPADSSSLYNSLEVGHTMGCLLRAEGGDGRGQ